MKVLLASHNAKKLAELRRIAGDLGIEVVGLDDVPRYDEPIEDGETFTDNALLKARAGYAASGLPTIADDSGIEVDVLNRMPGVRSARWAGPQKDDAANNALLLAQIDDVPAERRTGRFVAVIALVAPDGEHVVRGEMPGRIISEERGTNGFGYDPLFVPDGQTRTSAEMTSDEKDAISHRGRAMRGLMPVLASLRGSMEPVR
jgi:XTP/dITP diphosphohydrolase